MGKLSEVVFVKAGHMGGWTLRSWFPLCPGLGRAGVPRGLSSVCADTVPSPCPPTAVPLCMSVS